MAIKFLNSVNADSGVLYVDAENNRVGIGTTSPSEELTVSGSVKIATNNHQLILEQAGGTLVGRLSYTGSTLRIQGNDGIRFEDTDGSTIHGIITNGGYFGIGTTTPTATLHVDGNSGATATFRGATQSTVNLLANTTNNYIVGTTSGTLSFRPDGTEGLRVDSNGIEIPASAKLGTTNNAFNWIQLYRGSDASMLFRMGHSSVGRFGFLNSSDTEVFTIDARNEKVGIGTTSPSTKLHVKDTSGSNALVALRVENDLNYGELGTQSGYVRLLSSGYLVYAGSTSSTYFYNGGNVVMSSHSSGNVGIGTASPTAPLSVFRDLGTGGTLVEFKNNNTTYSQNLYLSFNSSKDVTWSQGSSSGGTVFNTGTRGHTFQVNGTTGVVFNGSGNVGIGTTAPTEKLQVSSGNLVVYPDASANSHSGLLLGFSKYGTGRAGLHGASDGSINGSDGNLYISTRSNTNNGSSIWLGQRDSTTASHKGTVYIAAGRYNINGQTGDIFLDYGDGDRMMLKGSSGNVGIGTTSPSYKLDVVGLVDSDGYVNNNVTFKKSFQLGNINFGTTYALGQLDFGGVYTHHFKVTISSFGVIKEYDFHGYQNSLNKLVKGHNRVDNRYSDVDVIIESIRNGNNEITGVKIGVKNGSSSQNDYVYSATIECLSQYSDWTDLSSSTTLTEESVNLVSRQDVGGEVMYINQYSQKVGIGTFAPETELHVNGTLRVHRPDGSNYIDTYVNGANYSIIESKYNGLDIKTLAGAATPHIRLLPGTSGNVGIGITSPSEKLHLVGNQRIDGDELYITSSASSRKPIRLHHTGYKGAITIQRDGVDNVHISSDQAFQGHTYFNGTGVNVGIGTTNPLYKLDVNGTFRALTSSVSLTYENGIIYHGGSYYQFPSGSYYYLYGRAGMGLIFGSNNSEVGRFDLSGNLGIGTTSPKQRLDVAGTGGKIAITNTGTSGYSEVIFYEGSTVKADIWVNGSTQTNYAGANSMNIWQGSSAPMAFYTNASERMRITADGKVGIGDSSPSYKLDVTGDARFTSHVYSNASMRAPIFYDIDDTNYYVNPTGATSAILAGSVGIGTTNPATTVSLQFTDSSTTQSQFHGLLISNTNTTVNNGSAITFGHSGSAKNSHAKIGAIYADRTSASEDTHLFFGTLGGGSYSERMRITSTGHIGMGTTVPYAYLHVKPSNSGNAFSNIEGLLVETGGSSNSYYALQVATAGGGKSFNVTNAGNVGIGTASPTEKLHVSGNVRIEGNLEVNGSYTQIDTNTLTTEQWNVTNDGTGPAVTINQKGAQDIMDVQDDGTSVFYIEDGGNVGLGTTDPTSKLNIVSTSNDQDALTVQDDARKIKIGRDQIAVTDLSDTATQMYINPNANVSINTTAGNTIIGGSSMPSSAKLAVMGAVYVADSANATTSVTRFIPISSGGNSQLKIKGGNFIHNVIYETSWNNFQYATLTSSYNGSDTDFFVKRSDTSGNTVANTKISTGTSYFNSSLGVGTTSPGSMLHVSGSAETLYLEGASNYTTAKFRYGGANKGEIVWYQSTNSFYLQNLTGGAIMFYQDGNERLRINTGGNVGIGSTSPADKLEVIGNIGIGGNMIYNGASSNSAALDFTGARSNIYGYYGIHFYSSTAGVGGQTERMRITNTGNVGIGTTSPEQKLHISGNFLLQNNNEIRSKDTSGTQRTITRVNSSNELEFGWSASGPVKFMGGGSYTERMRIHTNGNVGIGTTSPSAALHVQKSISGGFAGTVYNTQSTGGFGLSVRGGNSSSEDALRVQNVGGTYLLNVKGDGNVGIGTNSPTRPLSVYRSTAGSAANFLHYTDATAFAGLYIDVDNVNNIVELNASGDTASTMAFQTGNAERMRITSAGNVGIGTTAPIAKLDVAGETRSTNFQVDSGNRYKIGNNSQYITGTNDTAIDIVTGGTVSLRVADSGNVGIGTTSPSSLLHVYQGGNAAFTVEGTNVSNIKLKDPSVTATIGTYNDSSLRFGAEDNAGTTQLVIKNNSVGIGKVPSAAKLDVNGNVKADSFIGGNEAGIYTFSDTVNADSSEDIFSVSCTNGAAAFRVTFVCSTSGMSVAKTYEVVKAYGADPVFFKVVDTGAYSGHDFDVSFADVSSTGVKATITNNSTTKNADIVTTVFLGGSPTTITVTAL